MKEEIKEALSLMDSSYMKASRCLRKTVKEHGPFKIPESELEKAKNGEEEEWPSIIDWEKDGYEEHLICELSSGQLGFAEAKDYITGWTSILIGMDHVYAGLKFCEMCLKEVDSEQQ